MAMKGRHWIAAAVLGCITAAAFLLPPEPWESRWRRGGSSVDRAHARLMDAAGTLVHLRRVDSLLAVLGRRTPGEGSQRTSLLLDQRLPERVRDVIRQAIPEHIIGRRAGANGAQVGLAAVIDTGRFVRGVEYSDPPNVQYLSPSETDGKTCLVIVAFGAWELRWARQGTVTPRELARRLRSPILGPCAYFASYGLPGADVARWLERHHYLIAYEPPTAAPQGAPRSQARLALRGYWRRRATLFRQPLLSWIAIHAEACAEGDLTECRALASGDAVTDADVRYLAWTSRGAPLGPRHAFYLSDMATEFGDDEFRAFWTSQLPVDSAFGRMAGMTLAEWTRNWLRRQAGTPRHGPAPSPLTVLISLAIAGLAVGGGAWVAMRRTMA